MSCLAATAPVFAAVLAWLFIGERPSATAWMATGVALLGIYVIFRDQIDAGDQFGNTVALVVVFNPRAWLGVGETPASSAITGGGFIVAAVLLVVVGRRQRPGLAPSGARES